MPIYTPPTQDIAFILHELLAVQDCDIPGYQELTKDFSAAIVEEAAKLSTEVIAPLNLVGDLHGCSLQDGVVRTPPGFKEAFDHICGGGWTSLDCPEAYGGQAMPSVLGTAIKEMFSSANQSLAMYVGLTRGAFSTILAHGTESQKQTYLPKLASCEWTGTMNLTEPHCGTDLGLIRTKAIAADDGSYKISGQKIFISAGDHDLTENIVHLVLARIPGAPDGIKGISLFIVPKILINSDGSLAASNGVSTSSIEEKMGIHGNATCVLDYDDASGWLLGEEHNGIRAMFTMMNEARLSVGMQGLAQAEVAYQNAAMYAKERLQGRAVTGAQNRHGPADPLIVHPDIRRMLLDQKSFCESARAFCLWVATLLDRDQLLNDKDADGLVSLLIPVLKGFLTDKGFEMTVQAQQVFGGHGYIEEWGMSQFVRDARIAQIYEGTNGIQALDLVGRKLGKNGGQYVQAFIALAQQLIDDHNSDPSLTTDFLDPLKNALDDLQSAIHYLMEHAEDIDTALAGANDLMYLFGYVCLGFSWTNMAKVSLAALADGKGDADFYQNKLITGRYFMKRHLASTKLHLDRICMGSEELMALTADGF